MRGAANASPSSTLPLRKLVASVLTQWAVHGTDVTPVVPPRVGELRSDFAYVLVHAWEEEDNSRVQGVRVHGTTIYTWAGRRCGNIPQGTAALTARDHLDAHKGPGKGTVSLLRIVQGAEPPSFCRACADGFLVHAGGVDNPPARLYCIKGGTDEETLAFEVAPRPSSLYSRGTFALTLFCGENPRALPRTIVWVGSGSSDEQRQTARRMGARLSLAWSRGHNDVAQEVEVEWKASLEEVEEGGCTDEGDSASSFWHALGGRQSIPTDAPEALPSSSATDETPCMGEWEGDSALPPAVDVYQERMKQQEAEKAAVKAAAEAEVAARAAARSAAFSTAAGQRLGKAGAPPPPIPPAQKPMYALKHSPHGGSSSISSSNSCGGGGGGGVAAGSTVVPASSQASSTTASAAQQRAWVAYASPSGHTFYANLGTGETSWSDPYEWELISDDGPHPYWSSSVTHASSWSHPAPWLRVTGVDDSSYFRHLLTGATSQTDPDEDPWERVEEKGVVYFCHKVTNESVWKHPTTGEVGRE